MPRHQCVVYSGDPSDLLTGLASVIQLRLRANYRCVYLNSPPMVAGIRASLSAQGVDVEREVASKRLQLSSSHSYLVNGQFDPQRMITLLREGLASALADGYAGLWGSGDAGWEVGPVQDFSGLVEYERGLEVLLNAEPALSCICQYHADTLPEDVVRNGYALHRALFINETLTQINPRYVPDKKGLAN